MRETKWKWESSEHRPKLIIIMISIWFVWCVCVYMYIHFGMRKNHKFFFIFWFRLAYVARTQFSFPFFSNVSRACAGNHAHTCTRKNNTHTQTLFVHWLWRGQQFVQQNHQKATSTRTHLQIGCFLQFSTAWCGNISVDNLKLFCFSFFLVFCF